MLSAEHRCVWRKEGRSLTLSFGASLEWLASRWIVVVVVAVFFVAGIFVLGDRWHPRRSPCSCLWKDLGHGEVLARLLLLLLVDCFFDDGRHWGICTCSALMDARFRSQHPPSSRVVGAGWSAHPRFWRIAHPRRWVGVEYLCELLDDFDVLKLFICWNRNGRFQYCCQFSRCCQGFIEV